MIHKLNISVFNSQKDLPINKAAIKKEVAFILNHLQIKTSHISFHFVTGKKIEALHSTYFNDSTFTDCITFPIDPLGTYDDTVPHVLGEIFICPKAALLYAARHNLEPQDELMRYVIHGILHLAGYDDLTPLDKKKMRAKEDALLKAWKLTLLK